jgi:hypothetical protein
VILYLKDFVDAPSRMLVVDKMQCLYQGRHPCLRLSDTNVPLIFLDEYEEYEAFNAASFVELGQVATTSPSYHLSIFEHMCKLSIIMERIHSQVYAVSRLARRSDSLLEESLALQRELEAWRKNLPPHLNLASSATTNPLPFNLGML